MMQWEKMSYIDEGGKKIQHGLKAGIMMEVEAGNKVIEFGRQKQSEAQGRLEDISKEKDLVQKELSKKSGSKKQNIQVHVQVNYVVKLIKYALNCMIYIDMMRMVLDCFKILEFCL